ncbi:glucose/arabinose dehydrogenase [Catalinimonas alkaloidigena]|uniref:PQQ-dependent sugar dehydrogenase n=1 Tax=Catalinimonas alkaloidigena TaxID=1075417 RepID=UPI00240554C9|nr:PQQ-dependent sugar dehydrogenase [Catalinimonas alkaloidigena]MDF9798432.1 glucose/arabinose dehydrogenase [Catalinimonas alkaloidigena]
MKKLISCCIFTCITLLSNAQTAISTEQESYTVDTVLTDLTTPWSMAFLPDGNMLITEKGGKLKHFNPQTQAVKEIKGLPEIYVRGQGGLFDLELHPNYDDNGWIYITHAYSEGGNEGNTALMRAKLEGDELVAQEVLFKGTPLRDAGQHFGGRIEFDNDGYLYLSIGDRGARENAQNPENILGTVMRFNDDGSIPDDNPFVGDKNKRPEIFSYGHRNPQGMALHPTSGELWEHEHGPQGGDEINIVRKGNNYGWPVISYGINYDNTTFTDIREKEGMQQPVWYYVPSIAPCGMDFYTGDKFKNWQGDLFVGSLKFRYLERLELDGEKVISSEKLLEDIGRIRTVREGPDGNIYVVVEGPGMIVRMLPATMDKASLEK